MINQDLFNDDIKSIIEFTTLTLMHEKPITKITVTEISQKSNTSRVNFYNYFTDKYDVLEALEDRFLERFRQILFMNKHYFNSLEVFSKKAVFDLYYPNTLLNMQFFKYNSYFLEAIVGKYGDSHFTEKFFQIYFTHFCSALPFNQSNIRLDYSYTYVTRGIEGIVRYWIKRQFLETPEEISKLILEVLYTTFETLVQNINFP